MTHWIYRFLGIDPGQDVLRLDRVFFVQPWPAAAAVLFGLAAVAWVLVFYLRDGTRPSWLLKGPMAALRLAAVALLVTILWQPMLRSYRTEVTPSIVALLIDESRSMGLRDRWQDARRRAEWVRALGDPDAPRATRMEALDRLLNRNDSALLRSLLATHAVRVYRFGDTVREAELGSAADRPKPAGAPAESLPLRPGTPTAEQTRLGDAIDTVLQDTAGQPLAAIVLLSDGGHNVGEDPTHAARRAADLKVPIHTVGFGDPTPARDVALTSLLTDEVVRKGDEVIVSVGLRNRGFEGRSVPLTLKLGDRVLRQATVRLGRPGERQEINLSFTPDSAGAKTLVVSVGALPGELSLTNNRKSWPVRVVDKKLKILYVEGRPRWEFRYLKNAILRDRTTIFACLLADADPSLGGEGNRPIYGFPRDKKALFEYDILILGDVPRDFFTAVDLKNIRAFVEERGGSLVTIAGELFLPWQYRGTDLEAVWPIAVPPTRQEILFRDPFQLELTEAGARNPMMFLAPDPEQNRALWHSLPGMYWCGVAERVKPGATVLVRHPTRTGPEGKIPLMAVQQVGEGTSFMTMVDSTWQWRYRVGDKYFYRFWGQVIRSLTPHELPGANRFVRLTSDRATYLLGEKVVLRARLLTPSFHPVRVSAVTAELVREDGQRFPVRLEPLPGAAGVYSGEWLPPGPGNYRAVLRSPSGQQGEAVTRLVVERSSLETDEPQQNEALLRRLALMTGGRYLLPTEVDELPNLVPDRRQEFRTRVEHPLWTAPLGLFLFVLLLVSEWVLRKRTGLL